MGVHPSRVLRHPHPWAQTEALSLLNRRALMALAKRWYRFQPFFLPRWWNPCDLCLFVAEIWIRMVGLLSDGPLWIRGPGPLGPGVASPVSKRHLGRYEGFFLCVKIYFQVVFEGIFWLGKSTTGWVSACYCCWDVLGVLFLTLLRFLPFFFFVNKKLFVKIGNGLWFIVVSNIGANHNV